MPHSNSHDEILAASHYDQLSKKYLNSYKSLNWGSRDSQFLRFKILSEISDLSSSSILDFGCGLGDFKTFLDSHFKHFSYCGVDISPNMIKLAKKNHTSCKFITASFDAFLSLDLHFDFCFASGLFATYVDNSYTYLQHGLSTLYSSCRKGVAFNLLSDLSPTKDPNEFYANVSNVISICTEYTQKYQIRHDYHSRDFTVYLYK